MNVFFEFSDFEVTFKVTTTLAEEMGFEPISFFFRKNEVTD